MKSRGVRSLASLVLLVALSIAAPARAEGKPQRNLGAHFGLGTGAAICSLVYGPVKILYAVLGTMTSGFAWVLTGGRTDIARDIMIASVRGDYVVPPETLTMNEPLIFTGAPEGAIDAPQADDSNQWQ